MQKNKGAGQGGWGGEGGAGWQLHMGSRTTTSSIFYFLIYFLKQQGTERWAGAPHGCSRSSLPVQEPVL